MTQVAETWKSKQKNVSSLGAISRYALIAVLVMIGLNCAMVLSLQVFPNHDGPMFTYLARVTQDLLSGGKEYGRYYALKSYITPYAFNTYALVALNYLFDPIVSEKVYTCLLVGLFLGGFYVLSRSVSPSAGAAGLLAAPFVLHKLVFLGFQNFSAAAGMSLFLCAFWCVHYGSWRWWKTGIFAAALALVSITHPVGILVTGLFLGVHTSILALRYLAQSREPWTARTKNVLLQLRLQAFLLFLCLLPVILIGRFTPVESSDSLVLNVSYWAQQLEKLILLGPIAAFQTWYYAAPQAIMVFAAGALLWSALREKQWTSPEAINGLTCLLMSVILTVFYMVSPGIVARAAYFDQKFPILALVFFLVAAAWNRASIKWHLAVGAAACAVGLLVLGYQTIQCRQMNVELADVLNAPTLPPGSVGALSFEGPRLISHRSFSPMIHGGAYYFIRSHAVLINVPYWIDHPFLLQYPIDPEKSTLAKPPAAVGIRVQTSEALNAWLIQNQQQHLDFLLQAQSQSDYNAAQTRKIAEQQGLIEKPWSSGYFHLFVPDSR